MTTDLWQFRESMAFAAKGVDLSGFEVVGKDGPVGSVDKASNDVRVDHIIVDAREVLGRRVLLPAGTVERIDTGARKVFLDRTREEIRNAPEFDPHDRGKASYQDALHGYYHGLYDVGL